MAPIIPTDRHMVTQVRLTLAVAIIALASTAFIVIPEALATGAEGAAPAQVTAACVGVQALQIPPGGGL